MDPAAIASYLVVGAIALAGFLFVRRYGGGTALAELERANQVLDRRVHELTQENRRMAAELAELRAKTDFVAALQPIMIWAETHEGNAVKRTDSLVNLLSMIAERLGPEPAAA